MTPERWEETSHVLQPSLDFGGNLHSLEHVKKRIEDGKATYWPGRKSAIVTELINYPNVDVCRFWLAGGELRELVAMEGLISALMHRDYGVRKFIADGRDGWHRVLPGYRRASTVCMKDL